MTVKELIKCLKDIKNQDLPVVVKYRNSMTEYPGYEVNIYPYIEIDGAGNNQDQVVL